MKKLLSLFALVLMSIQAKAQLDESKGTFGLNNYQGKAVVIINDTKAKIQRDEKADSITFKKVDNHFEPASSADVEKAIAILQFTPDQINEINKLGISGSTPIAKLLNLANSMKDHKLIVQNGLSTNDTATEQDEIAVETPTGIATSSNTNSWLIPGIIGLAALLIGLVIGRLTKASKIVENTLPSVKEITPDSSIETIIKKSETSNQEVVQLKTELKEALEKNKQITEKTQKLVAGDDYYYNAIFDKIILPLQKALDSNNEAEVVKYINLATIHLSSITRIKIRKKLNYDDANIQLITGNTSLTQGFPTITKDTPIDEIPANIRVFISILLKSGTTSLDDTIIKGYKLTNL